MSYDITKVLIENGFSSKEAQVYIASLQLWSAPISSLARNMWENRVTIYATMKNLVGKWLATSTVRNKTTYYTVISPQQLHQKIAERVEQFNTITPEIMALANKANSPMKTEFFEWLEWLKIAYKKIITDGVTETPDEPFLSMMGAVQIDPRFLNWLQKEFIPRRLSFPKKTRSIVTNNKDAYTNYSAKHHNSITVDSMIFPFANEIVIYGHDKIAIVMYNTQEMTAMIIQSKTLFTTLKAMFEFVRNSNKKS